LKNERLVARRVKAALKKKERGNQKKWRSSRLAKLRTSSNVTGSEESGLFARTLEEYVDSCEQALVSAPNPKKPWLSKLKIAERARVRRDARLAAMQRALHPPEPMEKTLRDYVETSAETAIREMYKNIPYEKDSSPNLGVDNDFRTLRQELHWTHPKTGETADEDAVGLFTHRRDPGALGIPIADDYTEYAFLGKRGGPRPRLTEENAHRFTPMNPAELMRSPYFKEWRAAQQKEIDSLNEYKTWSFVKLDKKFKRITLRWVFKIKFKNGVLDKFKARLVARGFTQRPGLDYDPSGISAPVARASTIKIVAAEGCKNKHYFGEFDVKSAYLLAELKEDVFAALPYGVIAEKGTNSLKLNKSLYGLRQAGFNWNKKFTKVLENEGFVRSTVDPCLYTYRKGNDIVRIVLWVDDGLVSTNNKNLWHKIEERIHAATPMGSELKSDLSWLLGMKIHYNRLTGIMRFSQKSKIDALLERYGMYNSATGARCKPKAIPMPSDTKLCADGPTTPEERRAVAKACSVGGDGISIKSYEDVIRFCREVIGSIGYLACWARPDVRHAVYYLARYQANPSVNHFKKVKHLLRYLSGTRDLTLTFGTRHFDNESPLVCMVDSNYIGNGDNCYSTSGYLFYYHGCPVLCESKKQTAVSTSTTEAELIAASHAVRTSTYIRRLLINDFGLSEDDITLIAEDNQGCIHVSRGGGTLARLRHIRVADSYVYQAVKIRCDHEMRYIRSADNVSDIFTKACDVVTFKRLRWYLMGDSPNDEDPKMGRNVHLKYHWFPVDVDVPPVEECWRVCSV